MNAMAYLELARPFVLVLAALVAAGSVGLIAGIVVALTWKWWGNQP